MLKSASQKMSASQKITKKNTKKYKEKGSRSVRMAIFSRWISLGADVAKMDLARCGCGKNGSKNAPRRIKMSKNQLKEFKIPENGSRSVRMREKWISLGENGASGLQKLILGSQGGPKMEPRWLKMEPRWLKMGPR